MPANINFVPHCPKCGWVTGLEDNGNMVCLKCGWSWDDSLGYQNWLTNGKTTEICKMNITISQTDNYRWTVLRTAMNSSANILTTLESTSLIYAALGLAGETGEVVEIIKKHVFHGKALDKEKLIDELGDVRWYLEYLCVQMGVEMAEVEERNRKKLEARYPNGFNQQDANKERKEK